MPFFSIIVPTFNRPDLLDATVRSIQVQDDADFELVIIDDGSCGDALEHLRTLETSAKILRQSNRGPGSARNRGAEVATGEFLAFLDSDDLWFPWTLATYRDAIETCGRPAFVVGKPHVFSGEIDDCGVKPGPLRIEKFRDYLASGEEWRWWGASSFVIRKDAFLDAGGFVEDRINSEDADMALKLGVAAGFVQITSPVTFGYREHAANVKDDLGRTLAGIRHIVLSEQRAGYPGGESRARERWEILTRHVRPVALECLRRKKQREAWSFYRSTFAWHLSLRRLKYLVVFPLVALVEFARYRLQGR